MSMKYYDQIERELPCCEFHLCNILLLTDFTFYSNQGMCLLTCSLGALNPLFTNAYGKCCLMSRVQGWEPRLLGSSLQPCGFFTVGIIQFPVKAFPLSSERSHIWPWLHHSVYWCRSQVFKALIYICERSKI